jgi:hypothetical protein
VAQRLSFVRIENLTYHAVITVQFLLPRPPERSRTVGILKENYGYCS